MNIDLLTGQPILASHPLSGGGSGSGGSSTEGSGKYRVRFFDYDGTILKTVYTDGGAVTAPSVPDHERLLFQEWNNDFDNVTGDLDVGAIYTTKSGKCEIDIDINSLSGLTQYVGINLRSGTVTIEWGDGQSETLSTSGETRVAHTYVTGGKYTIMVSGTDHWVFLGYAFMRNSSNAATNSVNIVAIRIAGLTSIGGQAQEAFGGIVSCKTISLDRDTVRWGAAMFSGSNFRHINIPRMASLTLQSLANNQRLQTIVFPEGITSIPQGFTTNGGVRKEIVLPSSLTEIKDSAFVPNGEWVYMDGKVTIPAKVTTIANQAFGQVNVRSTLESVRMLPTTPPTIQIGFGYNVASTFPSNGSLKEITVPKGCAEAYKSATNWSYYADIIREEEI